MSTGRDITKNVGGRRIPPPPPGAFRVKEAVTKSADETVARGRGSRKEQWLQEPTWKLIGEKKATGYRDRAKSEEEKVRTDNYTGH